MAKTVRDPIAGLVLSMCGYLAKVENGTPEEIREHFMLMITKAAAVERTYARGVPKAQPVDAVEGFEDGS